MNLIKVIKSFHTIGNELKLQAATKLIPILRRDRQLALKELKLIDCRISPAISEQILSVLA